MFNPRSSSLEQRLVDHATFFPQAGSNCASGIRAGPVALLHNRQTRNDFPNTLGARDAGS